MDIGTLFLLGLLGFMIYLGYVEYKNEISYPKKQKENSPFKEEKRGVEKSFNPGDAIETYIVGVTYEYRQALIKTLKPGDYLYLFRDSENEFDANAIELRTRDNFLSVGYIEKELAQKIAPIIDQYTVPRNRQPITARILEMTCSNTNHKGMKIRFLLPDPDSFRMDIEIDFHMNYPL